METINPSTLIEDYAGLVSYIARKIHQEWNLRGGQSENFEARELVQVGWLGLLEAGRRFDPQRGIKFSTFATYRIRGAILDYLRAPLIRLPRTRQRQLAEIDRARVQLQHLGQNPSCARLTGGLAGRGGAPEPLTPGSHGVHAREDSRPEVISIEDVAQEGRQEIVSSQPTPEQEAFGRERQEWKLRILQAFEVCIKGLPFDLMTIFILRDLGELTLQEVAQIMGLKIDAVRRRQMRARRAIRLCLQKAGWPVEDVNELIDEESGQEPGEL
jgi:RNA polymerase sigma factor for flagellar operon FliA